MQEWLKYTKVEIMAKKSVLNLTISHISVIYTALHISTYIHFIAFSNFIQIFNFFVILVKQQYPIRLMGSRHLIRSNITGPWCIPASSFHKAGRHIPYWDLKIRSFNLPSEVASIRSLNVTLLGSLFTSCSKILHIG